MSEPQPLSGNPMFKIVDRAIRKEISWPEARARLRHLIEDQPELFAGVEVEVVQDLLRDEP